MRFVIRRTSDTTPPCEEAIKGEPISDPHTSPNGKTHINTEYPYYVEIETLEQLIVFAAKYGEIIIQDENWRAGFHPSLKNVPFLEIYDDWRE